MRRWGYIVWWMVAMALAPATRACEPLKGFDATDHAQVVVFGDLHGTEQPPVIFQQAACLMAQKLGRQRGLIGLELPDTFNAYFAHVDVSSLDTAWAKVQADPFWNEFRDGRHGAAMQQLVHQLLDLSASSQGRIGLVAIERQPIDRVGANSFAQAMASSKAARGLVFIGNAHARLLPMPGRDVLPFAANLRAAGYRVISLNVVPGKGMAWACAPTCGPRPLPNMGDATRSTEIVMSPPSADNAWDGYYYVPELTLSRQVDRPSNEGAGRR